MTKRIKMRKSKLNFKIRKVLIENKRNELCDTLNISKKMDNSQLNISNYSNRSCEDKKGGVGIKEKIKKFVFDMDSISKSKNSDLVKIPKPSTSGLASKLNDVSNRICNTVNNLNISYIPSKDDIFKKNSYSSATYTYKSVTNKSASKLNKFEEEFDFKLNSIKIKENGKYAL